MYKLVMNNWTVHSDKPLGEWGVYNHYSWGCMVLVLRWGEGVD